MEIGSSERKPKLTEVLDRARRQGAIHTAMPVVVVRYDQSKRLVDVKPLIKEAYLDENDVRQVKSFAVIPNVPIQWPGAGGYVLTFPISDGVSTIIDGVIPPATTGKITISERSIDRWLSGSGGEVDPEIDHEHDLSDAMFEPELRPFGGNYPSTPADHVVLGKDGGIQIHLRATGITIGDEAGSSYAARADKVNAELSALKAAFSAHTHAYTAPSTGGAAAVTGPSSSYNPNDVSASQAKVQ